VNLQTITMTWCKPIACCSLDVSLIPARPGIFEILVDEPEGERLFMGECEDLRQATLALISGRVDQGGLDHWVRQPDVCFRYWTCDSRIKRSQVAAALWDRYAYECGGSWQDLGGGCIRLYEED